MVMRASSLDTPAIISPNSCFMIANLQIHYDNIGGDTGEAVEVIFPTALTGSLTLTLYNGANGLSYGTLTIAASAGQPIGSTGFSVASVNGPSTGIQNGDPDGIALSCGGAVIQFLSYEGAFNATNGLAVGRRSTDIGVAEFGETLTCAHQHPCVA